MSKQLLSALVLSLASSAYASVATSCVGSVCYSLNIPDATVSSGTGDIFMQISGPTTYSWIGLGQGSSMSGANFFIVYTNSGGTNVTLSPRSAAGGHNMPTFNSGSQVTLLAGSGVQNGVMTANIKCANCASWTGGSMNLKSASTSWIYARKSGSALNTNSQSASISEHDGNGYGTFSFDSKAQGGTSTNPFLTSTGSGTSSNGTSSSCGAAGSSASGSAATSASAGSGTGTATSAVAPNASATNARGRGGHGRDDPPGSTKRSLADTPVFIHDVTAHEMVRRQVAGGDCTSSSGANGVGASNGGAVNIEGGGPSYDKRTVLLVHAVLACLAFGFIFPLGGIMIRVMSFPGLLWVHAAVQVTGYVVFIVAAGLGIYMATNPNRGELSNKHPIIGLMLLAFLFFQAPLGYLHHIFYKRYGGRTLWSYGHLFLGRAAVTLGIINGGFGFMLSGETSGWKPIVYAVCAGFMWLVYMISMFVGERRRSAARRAVKEDAPPEYR